MPNTHLIRRIQCGPEGLFDFVSDVEAYPEFINLLSGLRITKRLSETEFEAEAIVAKAAKGGVIKTLLNDWTFYPLKDGSTLVEVSMDVRLKAMPLEFLLRDKFAKASLHIIKLFEIRARQLLPNVGEDDYDFQAELNALGLGAIKVV